MDIYRSASRLNLDDATLLLMDINPSKATELKLKRTKRTAIYKHLFRQLQEECTTDFGLFYEERNQAKRKSRKTKVSTAHLIQWGRKHGFKCSFLKNKPEPQKKNRLKSAEHSDLKTIALLTHYIAQNHDDLATKGQPNLSKIKDKLIQMAEELGVSPRGITQANTHTLKRALKYLSSLDTKNKE